MHRLATLAAGLALAVNVQAATTDATGLLTTELLAVPLTLDKFDTDLGTLDGATLFVDGHAISTVLLDNDAANPVSASPPFGGFSSDILLGLTSADLTGFGTAIFFQEDLFNVAINLDADDGDGAGAQNGGSDEIDLGIADITGGISIDVTAFATDIAMSGGGSFQLECSSVVNTTVGGGGGNVEVLQATQAECDVEIVYAFTPVVVPPPTIGAPEPGTLALLGLGLIGFTARRARK